MEIIGIQKEGKNTGDEAERKSELLIICMVLIKYLINRIKHIYLDSQFQGHQKSGQMSV